MKHLFLMYKGWKIHHFSNTRYYAYSIARGWNSTHISGETQRELKTKITQHITKWGW